jgi:hypothetical protein
METPGKISVSYPAGEVVIPCEVAADGRLVIERKSMINFLSAVVKLDDEEIVNITAGAD